MFQRLYPADVPNRPILWTDGRYALSELVDPWHIFAEALFLNNFLARPRPAFQHPYDDATWQHVARGSIRLFSFGDGHTSYATILYICDSRRIAEIRGDSNRCITPDAPFAKNLMDALDALYLLIGDYRISPRAVLPELYPPDLSCTGHYIHE